MTHDSSDTGTIVHLLECSESMIPDFHNERWICICDRLRACEHRVRLHAALSWEQGFEEGRTAGLDAAREAVARQCGHTKSVSTNYECDHDRAIAAINDLQDALQDDLSRYE